MIELLPFFSRQWRVAPCSQDFHHRKKSGHCLSGGCCTCPGFTLLELLIVVAIVAILAAIAVPNFLEAQVRAKVARTQADLRAQATAIEAYAVDQNSYPLMGELLADGSLQLPQQNGAGTPAHKFLMGSLSTPIAYISSLPTDPFIVSPNVTPAWLAYFPRYFYTNLDWFARVTQPNPPPVIALMKGRYGTWILAGAGPDRDRLDLAQHIYYDPTNGTVSNGDLVRAPNFVAK